MWNLVVVLGLLAAVAAAVATTSDDCSHDGHIFELEPNADVSDVTREIEIQGGRICKCFDYGIHRGVTVRLDKADFEKVRATRGIAKWWPVRDHVPAFTGNAAQFAQHARERTRRLVVVDGDDDGGGSGARANVTLSSHVVTQVDRLHAQGLTGKGVKVAMICGGVDYEHEALGGCFGPGCLVSSGANVTGRHAKPTDASIQGTFLASVLAAQPNRLDFTGVAPGITLAVYGLHPAPGSVNMPDDVLVHALDRARADGADVILVTQIGTSVSAQDDLAKAVDRVVASGAVVVAGASNDGIEGPFSQAAPAMVRSAISVGNAQAGVTYGIDDVHQGRYRVSGSAEMPDHEATFDFYAAASFETGTQPLPQESLELYALSFDADATNGWCGQLPDEFPDLRDKIVLMGSGVCSHRDNVRQAAQRGVRAALLYQSSGGVSPRVPYFHGSARLAFGVIDARVVRDMLRALGSGSRVTVQLPPADGPTHPLLVPSPPRTSVPAVEASSAWGPSWDLSIKPELLGVGEGVPGAWLRGYGVPDFGTATAAPLIAGIVALILEARGPLDPATIKSLLVTTAEPVMYNNGTGPQEHLAPVAQQGGGLVRAFDAAHCTTVIQPCSLSFNDTENAPRTLSLVVENGGEDQVSYEISHLPALSVYAFTPNDTVAQFPAQLETAAKFAELAFSHDSVSLGPGQSVTVSVTPSPPEGLDARRLPLWSGYVTFNGSDGSLLRVPYQGLSGSIREHRVLHVDAASVTYAGESVRAGATVVLPPRGSGQVTNLTLSVRSRSGLAEIDTRLISVTSPGDGQGWGRQLHGFPMAWEPQLNMEQSLPSTPMAIPWNGRLKGGEYAAPGEYKLAARALRVFGDATNDADWDTSESEAFRIEYARA
ncbi:hypothetical protein ACCO45_013648 [Purpureocillium lilacinum]|uniref:Uncharacterized protein n=1 Tax=Purpureocillium lilacinum TaxID=33203 RepID=A0ACC4D6M4_PURLI